MNFYHSISGVFLKATQGLPASPACALVHGWGSHLWPGLISLTWVSALTATLGHPSGSQPSNHSEILPHWGKNKSCIMCKMLHWKGVKAVKSGACK